MGMAASQARFLGLTARKTNVEFEGQQINQQRTCLSNQSANYYNDLLGMSVPVAPSVDEYTKTVYSFNDGALTNTITSLVAQGDGKYMISYLQTWQDDFAVVSAGTSVVTPDSSSGKYKIGSQALKSIGEILTVNVTGGTSTTLTLKKDNDGTWNYYDGETKITDLSSYTKGTITGYENDAYYNSLTFDNLKDLMSEEEAQKTLLNDKYGTPTNGWYVRYVKNTSTGAYVPYFYNGDDCASESKHSSTKTYTIGTETKTKEVKGVKDCEIEKDSTGRLINITIPDEGTHSLTTSTVTDEDAYNDAMNQYEYEKYQYDQAIQEINAKIEVVQAQDKNLELRLKQLDTEQDAISQEMDSVSKVIEKNTESSFKTFG